MVETSSERRYFAWGGQSVVAEFVETGSSTTPAYAKSCSSFRQTTFPFGTTISAETTGNTNQVFTSYDRSSTTGLDYAVNRTYSKGQGRFTQVDPIAMASASIGNPQSNNLYAYVQNMPTDFVDPSGLDKRLIAYQCFCVNTSVPGWTDPNPSCQTCWMWVEVDSPWPAVAGGISGFFGGGGGSISGGQGPGPGVSKPPPPRKSDTDPCGGSGDVNLGAGPFTGGIVFGAHAVYPYFGISASPRASVAITVNTHSPTSGTFVQGSVGSLFAVSRSQQVESILDLRGIAKAPLDILNPYSSSTLSYGGSTPQAGISLVKNFRVGLPNGKPECQK